MFNSGEKSIFNLTAVGAGQFLAVNPSKKNSIMIKLSSESDMFYWHVFPFPYIFIPSANTI